MSYLDAGIMESFLLPLNHHQALLALVETRLFTLHHLFHSFSGVSDFEFLVSRSSSALSSSRLG